MAKFVACTCVLLFIVSFYRLSATQSHDEKGTISLEQQPVYASPIPRGFAYIAEHFDDVERFNKTWQISQAIKDDTDEDISKYDGIWSVEEPTRSIQDGDLGLVLKSKARHAAIATFLSTPFTFLNKPLVVQYEVNFQEGQECGGAYLKLLTEHPEHADLKTFNDKTPYTIMFGPDKCDNDHKLHFIFRHKNPLNGTIEEKHAKKPKERLEDYFKDKIPHLYTLVLKPDNTFIIKVDNKIVNEGSLLDDFTPPVNPPLEIEDPDDVQPEDWDNREKIPDPLAVKPEDWDEDAPAQIVDEDDTMPDGWLEDEPPMIPNPDSVKPDDWDVDMDGEWGPPDIPNPKCEETTGCGPYKQKLKKNPRYKGKWSPALINNPNYKGKWKPRLIHNPHYYNDEHPFRMLPVFAVGFELWSMSPDILFDNIIITDDEDVAKQWADESFEIRRMKIAENSWSIWRQFMAFTAEHPWMWAVYILVAGLPILLIVYCCCFVSQGKQDNVAEDKVSLDCIEDLNENLGIDDQVPQTENLEPEIETKETENERDNHGTEDIADSQKKQSSIVADGPRRRKPNKEFIESQEELMEKTGQSNVK
ncbi:calnexin isoform X2 [Venturia canescens]|uniref:calnexin isoform X2 n=1 Tax=Venturia canescens TaxID=32260 RepID=UPI001C9C0FFB|nr:calnexin isoform X2 [Venturia canescens]